MKRDDGETLGDIVDEMAIDDRTKAISIVSIGPEDSGISFTKIFEDRERELAVVLCSSLIKETVLGLDLDGEQFMKDVIHSYNDRDVIDQMNHKSKDEEQ